MACTSSCQPANDGLDVLNNQYISHLGNFDVRRNGNEEGLKILQSLRSDGVWLSEPANQHSIEMLETGYSVSMQVPCGNSILKFTLLSGWASPN